MFELFLIISNNYYLLTWMKSRISSNLSSRDVIKGVWLLAKF